MKQAKQKDIESSNASKKKITTIKNKIKNLKFIKDKNTVTSKRKDKYWEEKK